MTTTAEERAKEIMTWLRRECSDAICTHLDCPSCGCMANLTQALHQAQNDKLEEAAQCVRDNCLPAEGHYALEAINALKHKD